INAYKQNQEKAMTDKGESFLNSLSRELAGVTNIREVSQASLLGLVQSLSNTLSTDVHIYDLDGRLYASSRLQLFTYKLQGNIICPLAYKALKYENHTSKIHNETIGENTYKSSYYVIYNAIEEPIAYINIPFFSSQQDLRKSLTDFVVLLINIYLILVILVIIFTFFSVNAITKPLLIMQDGLSKMRLGSNEKIRYNREDEIGSLVDKYNVMVDELNASVEQLAKSEREVAWKRMARQIAHEIKNPLTPMKLSIQHLARTKTAAPEVFDDYFNKTAKTLIEQIDNLSNIATSFSTFAKITDGIPEHLSVNERLNNMVTLYAQSGSTVNYRSSEENIYVSMDKDHFIQTFNNLIKNALQAIPKENIGEIKIWAEHDDKQVTIFIKDNGSGIDIETQDKIFQPNFTTKNSGMGLGLAISKKMINNAGGDISFISKINEGTTFYVNLPRVKTNL
ncbi:MAG: HAMP domain-containing sensor histidine kinase, partial [Bacteroidales bacterium]|nr:HAMP domain-containing sensor histidine kinase [Bacteroidales bacterium]